MQVLAVESPQRDEIDSDVPLDLPARDDAAAPGRRDVHKAPLGQRAFCLALRFLLVLFRKDLQRGIVEGRIILRRALKSSTSQARIPTARSVAISLACRANPRLRKRARSAPASRSPSRRWHRENSEGLLAGLLQFGRADERIAQSVSGLQNRDDLLVSILNLDLRHEAGSGFRAAHRRLEDRLHAVGLGADPVDGRDLACRPRAVDVVADVRIGRREDDAAPSPSTGRSFCLR